MGPIKPERIHEQMENLVQGCKIPPMTQSGKPSTAEDLALWCNNLAKHVGLNREKQEGLYYFPPATKEDFQ